MHNNGHAQAAGHDHGHDHGAPESFIRKYVFSVDHKVIGIQYGLTAMVFLFLGFCFVLLMRWQLAFPEQALPVIGRLFGVTRMPEGVMLPEFYNQLGAMHGTIMVFLGVVPLAVGAFGNYLVPLQVGAPDMAFPKLNAASYWLFFVGGVIMLGSFFIPGGAAKSGWTSYPPLSVIETGGQTWWLVGMVFLINSSLLGSINIITTIVQLRAPGLKFMRMPFFIWAQLVTSLLLVLAVPAAGGGRLHAAPRPRRRHQFLHALRPGDQRRAVCGQRRRQCRAVAAPVLVPGPSRGVRVDPAGDGHRVRGSGQQLAQAAVRLQGAGLFGDLSRLHVVHRVGPTTCS